MNIILSDNLPVYALPDQCLVIGISDEPSIRRLAEAVYDNTSLVRPYCEDHETLKALHLDCLVQANQHPRTLAALPDDIILIIQPHAVYLCLTEASADHAERLGMVVCSISPAPDLPSGAALDDIGAPLIGALERIPGAPEVLEVTGVAPTQDKAGEWVSSDQLA